MSKKIKVTLDIVLGFYSLLPLVVVGALCLFVVLAHNELGYWPTPMNPDPKTLSFPTSDTNFETVLYSTIGCMFCFFPWLLTMFVRKHIEPACSKVWFGCLVCPWALLFLVILLDPGSYVEWFLD